jgi:hypothetical protein
MTDELRRYTRTVYYLKVQPQNFLEETHKTTQQAEPSPNSPEYGAEKIIIVELKKYVPHTYNTEGDSGCP